MSSYAVSPSLKALLADYGANHHDVLRVAGLPDDLLDRPAPRLNAAAFFKFCQAAEEAVADPLLPLALARSMSVQGFAPAQFAALCSPSLAVAAQRLARFKPLLAPIRIALDPDPRALTLRYTWLDSGIEPPRWLVAHEAVFVVQLARMGTRREIVPLEVTLPVLPDARREYESYLGVRLCRGEPLTLRFSRADAERPFLTADAAMWEAFEPDLRRRLADLQGSATFAERTRAVLLEALPSGQVTVQAVARRLAVSPRTLQRRLQQEGASFTGVVREVREELARHYLTGTQVSSTEIAYLLGFDEPSSFFRAFHQWTGQTPERLRAAALAS